MKALSVSLPGLSCSLCHMKHPVVSCSAVAVVPTGVLGVGQKVIPSFFPVLPLPGGNLWQPLHQRCMRLAQERTATTFDVDSHSK